MGKGKEFLVGAVNVGFYVINLKFIPVLAAPSVGRVGVSIRSPESPDGLVGMGWTQTVRA